MRRVVAGTSHASCLGHVNYIILLCRFTLISRMTKKSPKLRNSAFPRKSLRPVYVRKIANFCTCRHHSFAQVSISTLASGLKLKVEQSHPHDYSTHRQTPWSGNNSSLLFAALGSVVRGRTDRRYQVHYLPRFAVDNYT